MKKIIVCGDSFMTAFKQHSGTHFSEIFTSTLGYELISYARPGMTNGGIGVQIETAIRHAPDLILLNTTYPDRIEFAFDDIDKTPTSKLYDFDIFDIFYNNETYKISLADVELDKEPIIGADTLLTLTSKSERYSKYIKKWNEKEFAIKQYITHLHNVPWKQRVDRLQMYATLHRLELSNIPYIFCFDHIQMQGYYQLPWLTKKNDLRIEFNQIWKIFNESTNKKANALSYHTGYQEQIKLAKLLLDHYQKYF